MSKTRKAKYESYTLEELYLIADFPSEAVKPFLEEVYEKYKDRGEKKSSSRSKYPGISFMANDIHMSERAIRNIFDGTVKSVTLDSVDKVTIQPTIKFTLNDVTDAAIEWAEKTGSEWPRGYEPGRNGR